MKKIFFAFLMLALSTGLYAATPVVNEKVMKAFNQTFPAAEKVTWHQNNTTFEVYFINDAVQSRVWYDRDGNVLKSLRYYSQDKLSTFILARVQKRYNNKKIFGITEVCTEEGITYQLILEDDKNWFMVSADANGSLLLTKKLVKA